MGKKIKKPTAKNSKHKRKNSKRLFNLLLLNYTNKAVDLLQVAKNPMMTSIKTNCRPMLCSFLTDLPTSTIYIPISFRSYYEVKQNCKHLQTFHSWRTIMKLFSVNCGFY